MFVHFFDFSNVIQIKDSRQDFSLSITLNPNLHFLKIHQTVQNYLNHYLRVKKRRFYCRILVIYQVLVSKTVRLQFMSVHLNISFMITDVEERIYGYDKARKKKKN